MSCLKYISAWSRPLKPAPPETAAATMVQPLGHACSAAFLRPSEILKPPHRFGSRRRCLIYRCRAFLTLAVVTAAVNQAAAARGRALKF